MTNPPIMRLWSLAAVVLFGVVGASPNYNFDECICDLKIVKEAEQDITDNTAGSARRRRSLLEADPGTSEIIPEWESRLLFGFELNTALTKSNVDATLTSVQDQIKSVLNKTSIQYKDVEPAGEINSKKLYFYIDMKTRTNTALKEEVMNALKASRGSGSPPQWFGVEVSEEEGQEQGNPSIVLDYVKTVVDLLLSPNEPKLLPEKEEEESKTMERYLKATIYPSISAQPLLNSKSAIWTGNMQYTEMQFPAVITDDEFEEIQGQLMTAVKKKPPTGYSLSSEPFVALGPPDINLPGMYATMTITFKRGTTEKQSRDWVNGQLKQIPKYRWCDITEFVTDGKVKATINLLFDNYVTNETLDDVKTSMNEAVTKKEIESFTEPITGPHFMTNLEYMLSTVNTLENYNETQLQDALDVIRAQVNDGEEYKEQGFVVRSIQLIGKKIVTEYAFPRPIPLGGLEKLLGENETDTAKFFKGPYEINKPENTVKVKFTAAADQDVTKLSIIKDQTDFLKQLTTAVKDSPKSPENFVWAEPLSVNGKEIIVEFHFKDGENDPEAALDTILEKLTEGGSINNYKLDAQKKFEIIEDKATSTTANPSEGSTESTSGGSTESTSSGGSTESSSSGGSTGSKSSGGSTQSTSSGGSTESTSSGGSTESTSSGGSTESTSSGGSTGSTSESSATDTTASGEGSTTSDPSVKQPSTTYKGIKVKSDYTKQDCTCKVECSIEMGFTLTNFPWKSAYADTASNDFKTAATSFEGPIDNLMKADATIGPYFVDSIVTQISNPEGVVTISTDVQVSKGLACNKAKEKVDEVAKKDSEDGTFAGQTVDKQSFNFKEENPSAPGNNGGTTTPKASATTEKPDDYEDHNYFLTVTVPVMVGVLLLIILIMCCMRKDSLCCKIFATDSSESAKLLG